jgi:hypothetical protein
LREAHVPPKPTSSATVSAISLLVTKLLSHYWTSEEHAAARQAQVEDWIDDLAEFGSGVVQEACAEWRRSETRRPLPADIRRLCVEERDRRAWRETRALPPPSPVPTQRQRDDAEERRLALAINDLRFVRADAYRAGKLAEWDAANGAHLQQLRDQLRDLQDRDRQHRTAA